MMNNRFLSFTILILFCAAPALFMIRDCHALPPTTNFNNQVIEGTVIETMNTNHYTYMLLKTDKEEVWVAIPKNTTVIKGNKVASQPGMTITDFKSNSLNRTFATLVFSAGLVEYDGPVDTSIATADMEKTDNYPETPKVSASEIKASFAMALQDVQSRARVDQKMADMAGEISGGSLAAVVPAKEIIMEKASGENSFTIEECFSKRNELNTQKVQVRGKVVKISRMIMGKNWVHLQDGTGNPTEKTHNLVFTTQEVPELNSIITMEGILHADQDFGAGYKYKAIILDAIIL